MFYLYYNNIHNHVKRTGTIFNWKYSNNHTRGVFLSAWVATNMTGADGEKVSIELSQ